MTDVQRIRQQIVTAKDELRRIVAALNYPTTTREKKVHLRLEHARWASRLERLEGELAEARDR